MPELNPTTPHEEAWCGWCHRQKVPIVRPQHITLSVCDADAVPLPEGVGPEHTTVVVGGAGVKPETSTRRNLLVVVPSPSLPKSFKPQHITLSSAITAHE